MTDKQELKSCPCCSGKADRDFTPSEKGETPAMIGEPAEYEIYCSECGLSIKGDAWNEVIALWNTRHTPEAVKGVVEALEDYVARYEKYTDEQILGRGEPYTLNAPYVIRCREALKAYKIYIGE